jgi:hypothetical protein
MFVRGFLVKMYRSWIVNASLVAMAIAVPAQAQEAKQTVEGAGHFFSLMAKKKAFTLAFWLPRRLYPNVVLGKAVTYKDSRKTKIDLVWDTGDHLDNFTNFSFSSTDNPCQAYISVSGPYFSNGKPFERHQEKKVSLHLYDVYEYDDPNAIYGRPYEIDWMTIDITRFDGRINLKRDDGLLIALHSDNGETLDRLEYAAKFLKMSCDQAASTGF